MGRELNPRASQEPHDLLTRHYHGNEIFSTHRTKTPLPTTPPNNNCPALSHMTETLRRINRFTCEFSATCDKADCFQGEGGHIVLMLLPCHSPPGFRMIFLRDDNVLLNRTFTHSEENSGPYFLPAWNATMNVTVNHISDNEIEVEVRFY